MDESREDVKSEHETAVFVHRIPNKRSLACVVTLAVIAVIKDARRFIDLSMGVPGSARHAGVQGFKGISDDALGGPRVGPAGPQPRGRGGDVYDSASRSHSSI